MVKLFSPLATSVSDLMQSDAPWATKTTAIIRGLDEGDVVGVCQGNESPKEMKEGSIGENPDVGPVLRALIFFAIRAWRSSRTQHSSTIDAYCQYLLPAFTFGGSEPRECWFDTSLHCSCPQLVSVAAQPRAQVMHALSGGAFFDVLSGGNLSRGRPFK